MQTREQKNYIGTILLLLPIVFAIGAIYHQSAKSMKSGTPTQAIFLNPPDTLPAASGGVQSHTPQYNVVLPKGYKVFIKNTCLVYKGMAGDRIHMEVYLLEFDRDQSYPRIFTKASAQDGIWFGNVLYKLVKAKKDALRFKIIRIREIG